MHNPKANSKQKVPKQKAKSNDKYLKRIKNCHIPGLVQFFKVFNHKHFQFCKKYQNRNDYNIEKN